MFIVDGIYVSVTYLLKDESGKNLKEEHILE
ncbi:hypothetical protein STPL106120_02390 [Streptococcus pluranimalium]